MPHRLLGGRARALAGVTFVALVALAPAARAAAPDTQVAGPWVTRTASASYTLSASQAGSSFQCSVNWSAWKACGSPLVATLAAGSNSVRVRAVSASGETDPTPAVKWTQLDTAAPTVAITGLSDGASLTGPVSTTATGRDGYAFATLAQYLDGAAAGSKDFGTTALSGSLTLSVDPAKLAPGTHSLRVVATDRAGNTTAKVVGFTVPAPHVDTESVHGLFAPDSVWNAAPGAGAPLDPRSADLVGAFVQEVRREITAGIGPWINGSSYSTPLYAVSADQARAPVILDGVHVDNPLAKQLAAGVPIPSTAVPAKGTDAHLTVWQPGSDLLWELWGAVKRADGWHARWGGVLHDVSTNPGHFRDRRDATGAVLEQAGWGATATSLPVIAGTVTVAETQRGRIDHALALALPTACAQTFSLPAQRTDGTSTDASCLPEGAHLRLDPTLDLSKLTMPRFTRMLAEAAQKYGIVVRDQTSSVVSFFAEDPAQYGSDLWYGTNGTNGLLGAQPWDLVRDAFPWSRLQLLQMTLNH